MKKMTHLSTKTQTSEKILKLVKKMTNQQKKKDKLVKKDTNYSKKFETSEERHKIMKESDKLEKKLKKKIKKKRNKKFQTSEKKVTNQCKNVTKSDKLVQKVTIQ